MHEAAVRVLSIVLLLVFFVHLGFSFREEQLLLAVLHFELQFPNYAVFSLTVSGAIQKQRPIQVRLFLFSVIGPVLIFKLQDGVDQILNGKMSISYYVFPVVLEQGYGHIEKLFTSCLLRVQHLAKLFVGNRIFTPILTKFEYVLEVVLFAQHICVDSVHGY